jgi:FkbM family methyltransferase
MLDEIFSQREYDLPEAVRSNLAERDHLTVADLGANIGLFGAFILTEYPEARITAIEAGPANAAVHARTIEANRRQETWRLVTAFASTAVGMTRFAAGNFGLSRATEEDTGIEVPTLDTFPLIQGVDLVKIDVEGAEWRLLADRRFRELSASAVVLEYHRENCPGTDPAAEAERALRACGLDVARGASKPQFGAGVLWGWRR